MVCGFLHFSLIFFSAIKILSAMHYFLLWQISRFFTLKSNKTKRERYSEVFKFPHIPKISSADDLFSIETRVRLRVRAYCRGRKIGGRLEKTQTEKRKIRGERTMEKWIKNKMGTNSPFRVQTFSLLIAEEVIKYRGWRIWILFKGQIHPLLSTPDMDLF